jgi:hypothetical protein
MTYRVAAMPSTAARFTHYEAATRASQLAALLTPPRVHAAHKGEGGEDAGSSSWRWVAQAFFLLLSALVGYILATHCLPSATSPDLMVKGIMPSAMSVVTYLALRKVLL